ncbi:hypothetical protein DFA_00478 [Cavenderia fasciculata]|uniref:Uncharacterized protein n=1 Tax=Cavenderia fasciculata TaxID=261658 RepID=F4PS19_CACFS|nr:uncharacterized protein DFA_00478 [Cavenderia fasciculata]EGG20617.1 hypothetical protein DFA_00478 [Cavenderia fasciculata]|eukprot:XP_004358467.1 hypothetical protein DFA_00478 [Cavenderia fasciculata]
MALGAAAQASKDRFSPYFMEVLQVFDTIISATSFSADDRDHEVSNIGKFIRYVPHPKCALANQLLTNIIPKWLDNHFVDDNNEKIVIIDNLCVIIRLYTNLILGEQYQHVDKVLQIITRYLDTSKKQLQEEQRQLLLQTWLFIKDISEENWDKIPEDAKGTLSILKQFYRSIMMEQPHDEFIEIIVSLTKEEEEEEEDQLQNKETNNSIRLKSTSKQQYKEYIVSKPEQEVSWLLFLIVHGTYPTDQGQSEDEDEDYEDEEEFDQEEEDSEYGPILVTQMLDMLSISDSSNDRDRRD